MENTFESLEQGWRRPTTYEQDSVYKWMNEELKNRLLGFYLVGGFLILIFIILSIAIGSEKVRGEYQIMSGIVTFIVSTGVIVGICILLNIREYYLLKKVKAGDFTITKRPVLDKLIYMGKGVDLIRDLRHGCHVTVELKEGEKKNLCMTSNVESDWFDKITLGTEVTIIKFNNGVYGFYGEFDCMLMEDNTVIS